jgi:hypothetical protein
MLVQCHIGRGGYDGSEVSSVQPGMEEAQGVFLVSSRVGPMTDLAWEDHMPKLLVGEALQLGMGRLAS